MLGRLSAPLFLFCAVEGFTHTRSRKTYFLRVYALSALMTGLLLAMSLLGVLVRPDGFYPMNGEGGHDAVHGGPGLFPMCGNGQMSVARM